MFLIWGFRSRAKVLARLLLVCRMCSKPAAQTVVQRVRWFTLFFIPVIPFSRKHLMQCAMCGSVSEISKEDSDRLVEAASKPAVEPQLETTPAE